PNERNAWMYAEGQKSVRTTCGNGIVEGSEQCDKTDSNTGDGCSPYCRKEPICPTAGGPCKTQCGDGLLIAGVDTDQECDDGNTVPFDGCSADCKIEPGYACKTVPVTMDKLILPIVFRDFKAAREV